MSCSPLTGFPRQLTASLQGVNLYSVFHSLQSSLWTLWELVLLGEPLLVLGSSPPLVAQAVLALTSLVWPLTYAGDFRPFFNIHSDAFRSVQSAKPPALPSVLLGVTNPFILKTLKGWPHVLQLPEPPGTSVPAKGLACVQSPRCLRLCLSVRVSVPSRLPLCNGIHPQPFAPIDWLS